MFLNKRGGGYIFMNLADFVIGMVVGAYIVGCILFGFIRAFVEDHNERSK